MKILLATDAWAPQVNGVVRTLTDDDARARTRWAIGSTVIHPGLFRTIPCPGYAEIRLALDAGRRIGAMIEAAGPTRSTSSPRGRSGSRRGAGA